MDTRAPPIVPRTQERCCQHQHHQQQQAKLKHQQNQLEEEVSLPPLAATAKRQRAKYPAAPGWRNNNGITQPLGPLGKQEPQKRRPYKVLGIGATPLMHACQQADRGRVLKLLREQEETIGYRDRALRSVLHYCMDAATGGAVAQAAPELVNSPDAEGHTPLHLAVIAGDHQLVAVLLANGADVNAKDHEGHSVLHWATVCGEVECARLVLAAGARASSPDLRGGSPLHYAAQCCGSAATAELAVPRKVGLKVLQTLLEFGADVNARDEDGRQPVLWAASAGSVEAVLALVRAGGSLVAGASDKDGLTGLHCAASRGHARCIEALVTLCDAEPDQVDDNGCSALHYAATLGHADATSLLLKLGADPNRQDRKGRTPALCAAAKGQLETLKILAQHGGSLHARTIRGTGVAHEAVASGRLELIKWLAKRRPGLLDVATPDGKTPLHVAALHGHLDACKLLLDTGARINATLRTSKGGAMTALDAALYRGHRDCAKLIQLHGGVTAQHANATGATRVFSTRLRGERVDTTSSDSELSDSSPRRRRHRQRDHHHHHHHRHRDPDDPELYCYEERWTERRTRRRANRRRVSSRRDSRSFSEEELTRHSKASSATGKKSERQRRALSETARRDGGHAGNEEEATGSGRKGVVREEEEEEGSSGSSVSDDSLEVVVVERSLERTSEKIVTGASRKPKGPTAKKDATPAGGGGAVTSRSGRKSSGQVFDGDSTSQETVEQLTVTADVHKNEAPDSSRSKGSAGDREAEPGTDEQQHMRSKMDGILEKADELQSSLLSRAADLKKDVEEMRQQLSQKSEEPSATESGESSARSDEPAVAEETPDEQVVIDGPKKNESKTEDPGSPEKTPERARVEGDEDRDSGNKSPVEETRKETESTEKKQDVEAGERDESVTPKKDDNGGSKAHKDVPEDPGEGGHQGGATEVDVPGTDGPRFEDDSSSSSPRANASRHHQQPQRGSRPSTAQRRGSAGNNKPSLPESSEDRSPDRSAIVAVIESPEWDEDEELDKEIRKAVGGIGEHDEEEEDGSDGLAGEEDDVGIVRVLPSTSEEETGTRTSTVDSLPQLQTKSHSRLVRLTSPVDPVGRMRRDSGGRDSGIEPSPRVSRIPRRTVKCCPNSERQRALHMETVTRDVQISLRRYHLERKIFFQLMELKRLQIRQGRANEQVLVKRLVEAFNKSGMSGPVIGIAKYDRPYTFRHFEIFLYEQLRKLQRRPSTPDWCTEAKHCTQKTHRCHHATSAYTSVPIYTYLGGGVQERPSLFPKIEGRGKGQMTVEVTHGNEKQVIALPSERIDHTKRYFVTFTVRGETTDTDKPRTPTTGSTTIQRHTKSV